MEKKWKVIKTFEKNHINYVVYKFFKEHYEVKKTGELRNFKFFSLKELNEIYDLELGKVVKTIKKNKAKLILLQFPDGLKPYATPIVDFLRKQTSNKVEFLIWLDTCYGACDTPVLGKELEKNPRKIPFNPNFSIDEQWKFSLGYIPGLKRALKIIKKIT